MVCVCVCVCCVCVCVENSPLSPAVVPWAVQRWANYTIRLYTPEENPEGIANTEHAVVVLNHPGDLDWMIGWSVIDRFGMLGVRIMQ